MERTAQDVAEGLKNAPIHAKTLSAARRVRVIATTLAQMGATAPAWYATVDGIVHTDLLRHALVAYLGDASRRVGRTEMAAQAAAAALVVAALGAAREPTRAVAQRLVIAAYIRFAEQVVAAADDRTTYLRFANAIGAVWREACFAADRSDGADIAALKTWLPPVAARCTAMPEACAMSAILARMSDAQRMEASMPLTPHPTPPSVTPAAPVLARAAALTPAPRVNNSAPLRRIRAVITAVHADGLVMPEEVLVPLVRRAITPGPTVAVMWGRTGSGKTHMATLLAKHADLALVTCDASRLVASGYRGETVSSIVARIARAQKSSPTRRTLLVLDETDKLAHDEHDGSWSEPLCGQLLTLLGGGTVTGEDGDQRSVTADMTRVCVLLVGSFASLGNVDGAYGLAASGATRIGFSVGGRNQVDQADDDHARLVALGGFWSPEVVGRIGLITRIPDLSHGALLAIAERQRHDAVSSLTSIGVDGEDAERWCPSADDLAGHAAIRGLGARWISTTLETFKDRVICAALSGKMAFITDDEGELPMDCEGEAEGHLIDEEDDDDEPTEPNDGVTDEDYEAMMLADEEDAA